MNKWIIKCLKNSISEKGNYCYSLPVETTKAVIKELNRLNNIINEAINYIDDNTYYKDHKGHINIDDLYIILQKGSDKE